MLADASKDDKCEREAEGDGDSIDDALHEIELLLDHEDRHPEHAAVGRDQREEDAERLVEGGRDLLENDLHHLHQRRDDEDEGDGLHIDHVQRLQDKALQEKGAHRRQREYEGHGSTHTSGRIDLLRHAEEGTDAEELREDDVVDEDRRDEDE